MKLHQMLLQRKASVYDLFRKQINQDTSRLVLASLTTGKTLAAEVCFSYLLFT